MKSLALAAVFVQHLIAQSPLAISDQDSLNSMFDKAAGEELNCNIQVLPVSLDFELRYEVRFIVGCPLQPFGGEATQLKGVLRITHENGRPVFFGDQFRVPAIPGGQMLPSQTLRTLNESFEFSGGFAAGAGRYTVDLLIFDSQRFFFRHSWVANVAPHGNEKKADFPMKSGEVAPLGTVNHVETESRQEATLHLTVALKVAPMDRRELELRAWDRAFLTGALNSLLHKFPEASVRLVAFNLGLGAKVFEREQFKVSMLPELSATLQALELGKVNYHTIKRQQAWAELLSQLVTAAEPSDAIIFLGAKGTPGLKVPSEMLQNVGSAPPRIFYLEYFPSPASDLPDAVESLTHTFKGRVLKFYSPGDLAGNLQKMQGLVSQ